MCNNSYFIHPSSNDCFVRLLGKIYCVINTTTNYKKHDFSHKTCYLNTLFCLPFTESFSLNSHFCIELLKVNKQI